MGNRHTVERGAEIPENEGKVVEVGGQKIALLHVNGEFFALDNTCPHRGGPLGDGSVAGESVLCPWHGWAFDCKTGQSKANPEVSVRCFPAGVEGGEVWVEV